MIKEFGKLNDGTQVHLYILENNNYEIGMMDYGATLVYWKDKRFNQNIILGYDSVTPYINNGKCLGATVGRVCNRIAKGQFELNSRYYSIKPNNNGNLLHSGDDNFAFQMYSCTFEDNTLHFHLNSPDSDTSFPGNLSFDAYYTLKQDGLLFEAKATSDADTLFSPTNHVYFNLDGSETILNHYLQLDADAYVPIDKNGLSLDNQFDVTNTPFDFRQSKPIGQNINDNDDQLIKGLGYDHHFIIRGNGMRHFATLQTNKLKLDVYSTLPGVQLYTGNYLDNEFIPRNGVCLETQYVPNAINSSLFTKPILHKGETITHQTFYQLTAK